MVAPTPGGRSTTRFSTSPSAPGAKKRSGGPADAYLLAVVALLAVLPFFVPELRSKDANPERIARIEAALAPKAAGTALDTAAPGGSDTPCDCTRECFEVGGLDLGVAAGSLSWIRAHEAPPPAAERARARMASA